MNRPSVEPTPVAQAAEPHTYTVRAAVPPITERACVIEVACGSTEVYVRPTGGLLAEHWEITTTSHGNATVLKLDGDGKPTMHGSGEFWRGSFPNTMELAHRHVYTAERDRLARASLTDILTHGALSVPTTLEPRRRATQQAQAAMDLLGGAQADPEPEDR